MVVIRERLFIVIWNHRIPMNKRPRAVVKFEYSKFAGQFAGILKVGTGFGPSQGILVFQDKVPAELGYV